MKEEKGNLEVKPAKEVVKEKKVDTYIMVATHLSWGLNGKNHFYADRKPLISEKVMGKYAEILLDWLENGWIKEGSYK